MPVRVLSRLSSQASGACFDASTLDDYTTPNITSPSPPLASHVASARSTYTAGIASASTPPMDSRPHLVSNIAFHRFPRRSARNGLFPNRCFLPLIPILGPEIRKGPDPRDADHHVGCGGRVLRQCDIQAASIGDRCQRRMLAGTGAGELAPIFFQVV
jgi:hypothetical protein